MNQNNNGQWNNNGYNGQGAAPMQAPAPQQQWQGQPQQGVPVQNQQHVPYYGQPQQQQGMPPQAGAWQNQQTVPTARTAVVNWDQPVGEQRNPLLKHGPGNYLCRVTSYASGVAQRTGQLWVSAGVEILQSTNAAVPPGSVAEWGTYLGRFDQYFVRDIKRFLAACISSKLGKHVNADAINAQSDHESALANPDKLIGATVQIQVATRSKGGQVQYKQDGTPWYEYSVFPHIDNSGQKATAPAPAPQQHPQYAGYTQVPIGSPGVYNGQRSPGDDDSPF